MRCCVWFGKKRVLCERVREHIEAHSETIRNIHKYTHTLTHKFENEEADEGCPGH